MIARLTALGFVLASASLVLASASVESAVAQVVGPLAPADAVTVPVKTPARLKPASPKRTALKRKNLPSDVPLAQEPPDGAARMPRGITHARPADDRLSVGMSWNGSNTPNYGSATTSGLMNEYNHNLGAPSVGTGAEVGVKLKF